MQSQQKQKQRNKEERVKEALRVAKYRKAKKESGDGEAKKKSLEGHLRFRKEHHSEEGIF